MRDERWTRGVLATAGTAGTLFFVGLLVAPARTWCGYLMGFQYFVGLALAGPLFLAIVYLTNARWALPLRKVPEAMTGALPVGKSGDRRDRRQSS